MRAHWSTQQIAPQRRAEFWRAAVCEAFLAMTPRIAAAGDFSASLDHCGIDRLALNQVQGPAHGVQRTRLDLARAGPQYLFVNLNRQGCSRLRQFGREHTAQAGELLLIDSSEPYQLDQPGPVKLLSLAVPLALLGPWWPQARAQVASRLNPTPAAQLLAAQMLTLADCNADLPPAQEGPVADALVGLLRAALAPQDAAGPHGGADRSSGPLARRLRALVAQHYADPDFDPAQAALLAGISVRSLHACLAREGHSFQALLTEHRLQRARQALLGAGPELRVAEVALACGFRAPAHFARRFKARFGSAPGLLRAP